MCVNWLCKYVCTCMHTVISSHRYQTSSHVFHFHICGMTHWYVRHYSFVGTYTYILYYHPIDTSHDSFMRVAWLRLYIRMHTYRIIIPWICALRLYPQFLSNIPLSYLRHNSLICTTLLIRGYICIHTVLSSHRYARSGFIPSFWAVLCTWNETQHHVRMSHVAYINESCTLQHTATHWTTDGRTKDLRLVASINESWHCNTLRHAATRCNTPHDYRGISHAGHVNEPCHCNALRHTATHCNTLQHTTRLQANEPCGTNQWVMPHTWMCHGSQMNTS